MFPAAGPAGGRPGPSNDTPFDRWRWPACGTPGALAARLQLRVEWWHLPTDAGPAQAKTYFGGAPDECRLADLTGLAACAAKGPPEEGNLLPVAIRRELFFRRRWPWLAGAALVGIAAGQVPAWRWQGDARRAATICGDGRQNRRYPPH